MVGLALAGTTRWSQATSESGESLLDGNELFFRLPPRFLSALDRSRGPTDKHIRG